MTQERLAELVEVIPRTIQKIVSVRGSALAEGPTPVRFSG
jgi:hypothetical protein